MKKQHLLPLSLTFAVILACGCMTSNTTSGIGTEMNSTTSAQADQSHTSSTTMIAPSTASNVASPLRASPSYVKVSPTYGVVKPSSTPSPSGPFYGCKACGVYHYPWCSEAKNILPENLVIYSSSAEAQVAGMHPCRVCNPP